MNLGFFHIARQKASLRKVRFMYYYILTTGMNLLKVSSKGQIVIPEEIRRKLGLQKGSLIKVVVDGNKIVLVPAIEPPHEAFVSAGPNLVMQALKESKSPDDRKLRTLLRALGVKG